MPHVIVGIGQASQQIQKSRTIFCKLCAFAGQQFHREVALRQQPAQGTGFERLSPPRCFQ